MAVIATVAGVDSNSYLDVADADALAETELGSLAKAWQSATAESKEASLIRATFEIDDHVGSGSVSYSDAQALRFPRWLDLDPVTSDPWIPSRIRRATFLQAAYLLSVVDVLDDAAKFRARGLESFANPDGVSGTVSKDPNFGRMHPRVATLLDDVVGGVAIGTIVTT